MFDDEKSKEQLIEELNDARIKLSEYETLKAALEETQKKYRALFKAFPLGITISDRSGNIVESNIIAEKLLGLSKEEQGSRRIDGSEWSIIRTDGTPMPPSEYASVRALAENRLIENVEMGVMKPTGEVAWINVSAIPVHLGHFDLIITYGDITERKQLESKLLRKIKVLEGIARIFEGAVACESVEDLGMAILAVVEEITASKISFLGELGADGLLQATAISAPGWSLCASHQSAGIRSLPKNFKVHGLYRRVLQEGISLLTNDPSAHPDSIGVSPEHPALTAFLGAPLFSKEMVVGIIAMANREGGYSAEHQEDLESLSAVIFEALERKRVELALKESDERFRTFMDNSPAVSWIKNADLRYVFVSKAAERILGTRINDLLGKTNREIWDAEIAEQSERTDAIVLERNSPIEVTGASFEQGGKSINWHTFKFPLMAPGGGRFIGGISVDVTRQVELANNLDEANRRLNMALEAAKAGIWEWDLRTNANVWSEHVFELFGLDRTRSTPHFDTWLESVKPDQRENMKAYLDDMTKKGGLIETEWQVNLTEDRVRWLFSRGMPKFSRKGTLEGYRGVVIDITDRVLAEQARKEIDAKLVAAMESMADAVFISDANGNFIHFNDAFATFHKFKNKDDCFKTLIEYPDILDVFMDTGVLAPFDMWAVPRALRGETVMNAEYGLRRKDTGETWIGSYNFAPIRNANGSIVGSVIVGRDITARKDAERRLRESEEKFRKLFNSLPVATVIVSLENDNFVEVNAAFEKIMGYSRSEALLSSVLGLGIWVSPEDHSQYTSTLKTERVVENFETSLRSRDGRIMTVLISGELIEVSEHMWTISSWLDISERRRLADDLTASSARLEDMNAALRVLLEHREQDRPNMERRVLDNMRLLVMPFIEAIRGENPSPQVLHNLNHALSKFEEITAGFAHTLENSYRRLTVSEIRVADMIRSGMTSKEIAHTLGLSVTTANFYRASIRRKLGLVGKKDSLIAFLRALQDEKGKAK